MAKEQGKLTAMAVKNAKKKGLYSDGGNLYLQVTSRGSKSWLFRYMIHGKAREMGLGALHTLSLAEARLKAADCRKQLLAGIEPLTHKKAAKTKAKLEAARTVTFRECAEAYIKANNPAWTNEKHEENWGQSLAKHVYPIIGDLPVQDIDVALVMKILEPIWRTITETATRIRGRIEAILDWATTHQYRHGNNPARWKGHLENLLPSPSKIAPPKHQPALPYKRIQQFLNELTSNHPGTAARALQLVIFTATRTVEARGAKWQEFDLDKAIWTVPAERVKTRKEHRIPLSGAALNVLQPLYHAHQEQTYSNPTDLVFQGQRKGKPLSAMALLMLLRRMNPETIALDDEETITVHGFRSTFRDWAAEQTNYPREVAEAALSHANKDKVEAAYRRSDLFEKRRSMMEEWAAWCMTEQPTESTTHDKKKVAEK